MALRLQDAIDHVSQNLKIGPSDAAVYVQLCVSGPAKVSDLADALHLHRNDVYRTAERLIARGLIETTVERPARYVAVDPEKVFDHEINSRVQAIEALRSSRTEISSILSSLQLQGAAPVKGVYRVIQGRSEIYAQRDRMLAEAKTSIDWASTFPAAVSLAEVGGGLDIMRKRVEQGIAFRALLKTTAQSRPKLAGLVANEHADVRQFDVEGMVRFLVTDRKELLMFVVNDPSESLYARDEVAIHSTAPGFVHAQQFFFDQAYAASASVAEL